VWRRWFPSTITPRATCRVGWSKNYHGHHDLSLATLHVHLDDDNCMEVTALRGSGTEVQHFADHIIAERGVKYGRVVMIPQ
jgi:CopG family nickel-responsive transcriptional regulator